MEDTNYPLAHQQFIEIFDPLIKKWGFKLSVSFEGDKKIILSNNVLKILFIEEYRPPRIFIIRLYDGKDFYVGMDVLYKYKNHKYSLEQDSLMTAKKLKVVTDFLIENYPDLLSGDEKVKKALLEFSKGRKKS